MILKQAGYYWRRQKLFTIKIRLNFSGCSGTNGGCCGRTVDKEGGLSYEYDPSHGWIKEKHWWPQAEAMIGFFNAWQISRDDKYLRYSMNSWYFINKHILDKQNGEWFWGVNEDYTLIKGEDKVGIWKCPYHNTRACIEIIRRIETINS
ncbi:MAG: AGE family epimerase/isomerase [Bacteroidota bacterium]